MHEKKLVSIFALALATCLSLAICVSVPRVAKASGAPSSTGTTGAANLKGTVKFEGTVPKPKVISMAADPSCAKQHSSPVFAQEVVTDSKGDLQNVIVFVADGLGDRTFDPPAQPAVVEQKGCMYEPHI